jgi:hypothetical protein
MELGAKRGGGSAAGNISADLGVDRNACEGPRHLLAEAAFLLLANPNRILKRQAGLLFSLFKKGK